MVKNSTVKGGKKKASLCKGRSQKQCYHPCKVVVKKNGSTYCRSVCKKKKGKKRKSKSKAAKSSSSKSTASKSESSSIFGLAMPSVFSTESKEEDKPVEAEDTQDKETKTDAGTEPETQPETKSEDMNKEEGDKIINAEPSPVDDEPKKGPNEENMNTDEKPEEQKEALGGKRKRKNNKSKRKSKNRK